MCRYEHMSTLRAPSEAKGVASPGADTVSYKLPNDRTGN